VYFVEDNEWFGGISSLDGFEEVRVLEESCSVLGDIPVEMKAVLERTGDDLRECCLPRLAWPDEKDHALFSGEFLPDSDVGIPSFHGDYFALQGKTSLVASLRIMLFREDLGAGSASESYREEGQPNKANPLIFIGAGGETRTRKATRTGGL